MGLGSDGKLLLEDEIVISGISGRFPESNSMNEFMENLLGNKNMVTCNSKRFKPGLFNVPKSFGTLKEIDKFDAEAFGILPKQADNMDPQSRIALETTYEALIDAGVNPKTVRGQKTGVFTAVMFNETMDIYNLQPARIDKNNCVSLFVNLIPNRISYTFDWTGPSANYDTGCSSSLFALEAAINAIKLGKCDDAVIIGSNLILTPLKSLIFNQAGMLSNDCTLRAFDTKGAGFVRAEAVVAIYIQKKSLAFRSYLTILGIGNNTDGFKKEGNFSPSSFMQEELLEEVYTSADVDPENVSYVEAHGTGTPAGDPPEIKAISRFFCQNNDRKKKLLVGSVKSCMGHSESASGLCAIAKIIVIVQSGIIPANLHFEEPHYNMKYIRDNKIEIVTKSTKWEGGLIGLSSFGIGGVNTHVILKPNIQKQPIIHTYQDLILFSGNTYVGVKKNIEEIFFHSNPNQFYLINEVHKNSNMSEKFRGFGVGNAGSTEDIFVEVGHMLEPHKSSLWFVFNGMGSQWIGMGQSLLQTLPGFKKMFVQCCKALQQFNYDLEQVFNSTDPNLFSNNPTNSFVCIGVVQIGLFDVLTELGLTPDGVIGHSCGEHLCAYADGCLTKEQTIISLYLRGEACKHFSSNGLEYGMAAVNMGFKDLSEICPKGLYAVCDNGPESTTIAGPAKLLQKFKVQLENISGNINVKEVQSSGIPFHSPYLSESASIYKEYLEDQMNIKPKYRSKLWVSSSIPSDQLEWQENKLFNSNYFFNNFISPVYFQKAMSKIPINSTVIEIGPSGLLRGLIQRGTKDSTVIPLQTRNESNCLFALQKGLGRLFLAGWNFDINKIASYANNVKLPVEGTTPMIGHLVDWDHSVSWSVPNYQKVVGSGGVGLVTVNLSNPEDAYLEGHMLQSRVLYPTTGYIHMVRKLFAQMNFTPIDELPVVFENLKIQRVTLLRQNESIEFHVTISEVSGMFEIKEGDAVVCCGKIRLARGNEEKMLDEQLETRERSRLFIKPKLNQDDIYKKLRLLGYEYHGLFKGILNSNLAGTDFNIEWNNNWVGFLDTFLQPALRVYSEEDLLRELAVPTEITKILINPIKFHKNLNNTIYAHIDPYASITRCRGIEVEGIKTANLSKNIRAEQAPVISNYAFEPYFYDSTGMVLKNEEYSPLLRCLSIVVDNMDFVNDKTIQRIPNILEISTDPGSNETLEVNNAIRVHFSVPEINYIFCTAGLADSWNQAFTKANIKTRTILDLQQSVEWIETQWDLIILDSHVLFEKGLRCLGPGGFLILKLPSQHTYIDCIKSNISEDCCLISHKVSEYFDVFLIRKKSKQKSEQVHFIEVQLEDYSWVEKAKDLVIKQELLAINGVKPNALPRLVFVSNGIPLSGILGFMQCFKKEPFSSQGRCIFSTEKLSLNFDDPENDEILKEILDRDLVLNVFNDNGIPGCYVHSEIKQFGKTTQATSSFLNIETPGDLTSLKWFQGLEFSKLRNSFPQNYVPVHVHVSGLNFKDVMIATGNLAPEYYKMYPTWNESPIGLEFSGIVESMDNSNTNRRVCGFTSAQCLATQVLVDDEYLLDVPEVWTMEEAATVPVVYSTAYYALVIRGNIQRHSSILIHSGAGGVGIAAIRIALSYNCQIFVTVSSERKIHFIKTTFPEIPESNIGYSRDTRFEQMVRRGTRGRGVDLILNSLSGDKLEASLRCLAPHGQFLEIGRVDLSRNAPIGSDLFLRDTSVHGIFLVAFCDGTEQSKNIWRQVKPLILEGINTGVVKPLPYRAFNKEQIEPAFRFMGQGVHIGKVVINIREKEENSIHLRIPSCPQAYFHPDKVYVIFGGLGGVGLEIINWMTLRYARKFLITSRSGSKNLRGYAESYLKIWKERGVTIEIMKFSPQDDVEPVFNSALKIGDGIGGVFNLTMHLDPRLLKISSTETFKETILPKIGLTFALDDYSRNHCPELVYFVVFSSISAGLGYDGMTSYGFGNSSIERLIEKRQKDKLPGTCVQFGPIGDVGAWHDSYNMDYSRSSFHGSAVQSIGSVLKSLDYLLSQDVSPPTAPVTLCRRTIKLNNRGDGSQILEASLLDRLAQILGHSDGSKLNPNYTLAELGMESVMSIEAKAVLENEFGLTLSASALREYTLEQLNEMAENRQNERTVIRAQVPNPVPATAGLVQLNFFKNMNRFNFDHILNPINDLAKCRLLKPGPKVLICNSFEGPQVLRPLASHLKVPTYALQFPPNLQKFENIKNIALHYYEHIKEHIPVGGPFLVAGLSAGIYPGFELALILQKENQLTKLIFMDMTFERFNAIIEENGGTDLTFENASQNVMLGSMCQVFGFELSMLHEMMRNEPSKEGQMDRLLELITRATGENIDRGNLLLAYDWSPLFTMCKSGTYKPSSEYDGEIGLIKTTQNVMAYDSTCENWGIEKICKQKADILTVGTTHSYMIAEPAVREVAKFFNKSLK